MHVVTRFATAAEQHLCDFTTQELAGTAWVFAVRTDWSEPQVFLISSQRLFQCRGFQMACFFSTVMGPLVSQVSSITGLLCGLSDLSDLWSLWSLRCLSSLWSLCRKHRDRTTHRQKPRRWSENEREHKSRSLPEALGKPG